MTRRQWMGCALAGSGAIAATTAPPAITDELVLEATTGRVLRSTWTKPSPEPAGSLVKIFTGIAYGTRFRQQYPRVRCGGAATQCWLPGGHGELDYPTAIAHSCNTYFLELARAVTHQDVALVASQYHLDPPAADAPEARIGLGRGWLVTPDSLARAYVAVAQHPRDAGIPLLLDGLRRCARSGTAKEIGVGALAKTGTSVCVHRPAMPGDGWAIGLYPDSQPRYAVLVRVHGVPGSIAAQTAAARLAALRQGR